MTAVWCSWEANVCPFSERSVMFMRARREFVRLVKVVRCSWEANVCPFSESSEVFMGARRVCPFSESRSNYNGSI